MTVKECYDVLELPRSATLEEVKSAYRRLAFALHPDLNSAPDASRRFQAVNEAYVLLRKTLEADEAKAAERRRPSSATQGARQPEKEKKDGPSGGEFFSRPRDGSPQGAAASEDASASQQKAAHAYTRQEEVLQDILHDPFARRVYEDIYSQIRKETGTGHSSARRGSTSGSSGRSGKRGGVSARKPGIISKLGDWFRRKIDDEQTIYVSPSGIHPGARILLKIQQGMADEVRNVEIVLPADFNTAKPLRLKGLGRKVGPWQGDLYLRVLPKEAAAKTDIP